ncbi:unnamed protein product [Victoria cruziana]
MPYDPGKTIALQVSPAGGALPASTPVQENTVVYTQEPTTTTRTTVVVTPPYPYYCGWPYYYECGGPVIGYIDTALDESQARALLGRLGYGATPASLQQTTGLTPRQYLMHAITGSSRLPPGVRARIERMPVNQDLEALWRRLGPGNSERKDMDAAAKQAQQREMNQYASATVQARLLAMANSDNPGHEALLSFWLNHFSIYAPKGPVKLLGWDYIAALERAMQADSFEALLRASFRHPAMQIYLDNAQSTAPGSPAARLAAQRGKQLGINENLARELMELHTLGVDGGYSQADVQALARIITGAGVYTAAMQDRNLIRAGALRTGLFLYDPRRHDEGVKLAQRFLADDPPAAVVDAMSAAYLSSGGRISATLLALLDNPAFNASLIQPRKFKEPLDYLLSLARTMCGDQPVNNALLLASAANDLGQAPLMHSTPDGYGARESDWLSPVAMAKRTRLAMGVAAQKVPLADGAHGDEFLARPVEPQDLRQGQVCEGDEAQVARLIGPVSALTQAQSQGLGPRERIALWLAGPEFMRR